MLVYMHHYIFVNNSYIYGIYIIGPKSPITIENKGVDLYACI